jgi:hypothetical protein
MICEKWDSEASDKHETCLLAQFFHIARVLHLIALFRDQILSRQTTKESSSNALWRAMASDHNALMWEVGHVADYTHNAMCP